MQEIKEMLGSKVASKSNDINQTKPLAYVPLLPKTKEEDISVHVGDTFETWMKRVNPEVWDRYISQPVGGKVNYLLASKIAKMQKFYDEGIKAVTLIPTPAVTKPPVKTDNTKKIFNLWCNGISWCSIIIGSKKIVF